MDWMGRIPQRGWTPRSWVSMTDPVPVGIDLTLRPMDTNHYAPITRELGFDAGRRLPLWQFENEQTVPIDTFTESRGLYISDRWNTPNMWWLRYADRDRRAPYTAYMDDFHRWADINDQLVHDLGMETFQIRTTRVPSLHYVMSIVAPDVRRPSRYDEL
jgi:hypothetical protein